MDSNSTFHKVTYNILARKHNRLEVVFLQIEVRDYFLNGPNRVGSTSSFWNTGRSNIQQTTCVNLTTLLRHRVLNQSVSRVTIHKILSFNVILMCVFLCIVVIWEEENQLDVTKCFIELVICSTCFGHVYAHHQELVTILLVWRVVCNSWLLVVRRSGAGQQAVRPEWGLLFD